MDDEISQGLENIYAAVVKLILTEKILGEFNGYTQKYSLYNHRVQFERYTFYKNKIKDSENSIKERDEKYVFVLEIE